MPSILGLMIADALASRLNITNSDALNRIRITGAVVGASPVGIIVSDFIAQREAQSLVVAPTPAPTTPTTPTTTPSGSTQTMVQVPDVTGMAVVSAETLLKSFGLNSQRRDVISSDTVRDIVIEQKPSAGDLVPQGTIVILSVSLGFLVPDVRNLSLAVATTQLQAIGLQVQTMPERNSSVPKDAVVRQDPVQGSYASKGDTVRLTVSLGANIAVPDVVGLPVADAQKQLQDAGLQSTLSYGTSGSINKGFVIKSDPLSGTPVAFGSTITLTVSRGEDFEIPNVTGQSFEDAEKKLKELKLQVKREDQNSDVVREGFVISQDPVAGTQVSPNGQVTLLVSKGIATADLPDLRGESFRKARETLQDLDFKVKRVDMDSDKPKGTVVDQDPKTGKVAPETTVTLSVSTGIQPPI